MAFLEMYLNGEWKNLSSFGTVSSVDIQSSSSAISVTGSPITSVGIINLSFNPSAIRLDQFAVPTSNLDINNKNLINVATPTLSHHATNKSYVDSKTWTSSSITDFSTSVTSIAKLITLDQFAVPMASLSMNNYRITSVSDPVNPQDVATKAFVQASIPTISVTGAVIGTINSQGVINTSLSQYIPISGSFINFNWPDMGSYSSPYSLYNYLPNADPAPIFNISSQTGSGATNSLRRWSMQFSQGSATSIGYEFALSFYHSLIVGDHTVTPLRIVYSIPDDQPRMYLKAILDMYNYKIVNVPNPTASDHAANKGYIDSKTWTSSSITDFSTASTTAAKTISLDQFAIPAATLNLNNKNIANLATPTLSNHAADKYYVDSRRISDFNSPITDISMNTNKIINLASPTLSGDAVNKNYVDTRSVNELAAPISAFSMNNNRITSVANPISAGDVATKNYVDSSIGTAGGVTWISYTPTITCPTTNPTLPSASNVFYNCQYTVVGKTMFIRFYLGLNATGTKGSGLYLFSIPSGYTIDSSIYFYDQDIITRNASITGSLSTDGYWSHFWQSQVGVGVVSQGSGYTTDVKVSPVYAQGNNKLCLFSAFMATTGIGFLMRNCYINSDYFMFTGDMPAVYKFNATIKIV